MTRWSEGHHPRRPRSVSAGMWMSAAIVVITLLFLSLNWYYYDKMRSALDAEFGVRLRALASLAAASIDPQRVRDLFTVPAGFETDESSTARLEELAREFDLASIQVVREDGIVLLTTRPDLFPPGELYPMWNMDYGEIIRALEGAPSSTGLYRSPGGGYLKAGYAPLAPLSGKATAVIAAEADADFLMGMSGLRTLLIFATTISLAGLAIFVLLVYKAAGSLIRTRESLMQAETLASMGRMAAGIAHEVRNPLFIIRSSAERLREEHPEEAGRIDEFIIDEVDRLDGILTDYLLFARNESTSISETDLVRVLERCIRLVSEPSPPGEIRMETRFELEEAPFTGEEKKLQQVFINLLLNAVEAMDGSGTVSISLARSGSSYELEFSDTGPGIPEKDMERVFEPFYTTRPSGSGLGLAIARKVIEDHGGSISIAGGRGSGTGRGTVVLVRLPADGLRQGERDEQGSDHR